MKKLLNDFIKNEDGVTAIEYAMIGVAMAVGLTAILGNKSDANTFLGALHGAFSKIATTITNGGATPGK
ncbi:Flp family type IVb pilin [Vibrio europaeus]|uniref:Flp family type IVb pilin n=1 Tax=Vibrio europaeus TaxID=300876 RepID=UPI003CE47F37